MHLDHLQANFDKRGVRAELFPPATDDSIQAAEACLGLEIPDPVRAFYTRFNGLRVDDPPLKVLPVEELAVDSSLVPFATIDGAHRLCFDVSRLNEAEQWNIVDPTTNRRVTLTMASFWSNKIWKWIDDRVCFWRDEA